MDDCSSVEGKYKIRKNRGHDSNNKGVRKESAEVFPSLPLPCERLASCKDLPQAQYGLVQGVPTAPKGLVRVHHRCHFSLAPPAGNINETNGENTALRRPMDKEINVEQHSSS